MDRVAACGAVDPSSILGGRTKVGWQSGQMRGFRKPEGESPTQVQILYPPPFYFTSLAPRISIWVWLPS